MAGQRSAGGRSAILPHFAKSSAHSSRGRIAGGEVPDYRHFSPRRRQSFREAAERGLQLPESELPVRPKRRGTRPTREMERAAEELRRRRDAVADQPGLEPSLIAPRGALDALAADETRLETLLVPWQRDLLEL